ncbi:hypothetical protein O181_036112 [Austropuccinia psidii MF-1]|uniref:Uncharacterized protein n=1 Tax=Austropuccinia psidii MF-1 TaxID=1389203 RepID=A0A9Q3DA09_9BASI|nr:hypothetical protein [Austropuccinia psidii MF-1]
MTGLHSFQKCNWLENQAEIYHRKDIFSNRESFKTLLPVDNLKKNILKVHSTAKDCHDMWKNVCDKEARFIVEAKEFNKQRYEKTCREPDFRERAQVLVSTLNFDNLKAPDKMRDLFV